LKLNIHKIIIIIIIKHKQAHLAKMRLSWC